MEKKINNTDYVSPSIDTVELVLEGSILQASLGDGTAGGDVGGETGWE